MSADRGARIAAGLATLLVWWARAHADGPPRATCENVCVSVAVGEPSSRPTCPVCPPLNVCSDLYHADRPAWDACMAKGKACQDDSYACGEATSRGYREHNRCAAAPDLPTCCARRCQGDEEVEASDRFAPWFYLDGIIAGGVRHSPGDASVIGVFGGEFQVLFGPRSWSGHSFPFRVGAFGSGAAILGAGDGFGAQIEGGLSALVYGKRTPDDFGAGWLAQAGALVDFPTAGPTRLGGMARVSVGITSTGQSSLKLLSAWLFVEGQYLPAADGVGSTWAALLGFRMGPLVFPVILIPGAADPL